MHVSDAEQLAEQACEFPVDRDDVVSDLGEVKLTAPSGESLTLGEVLERSEKATYHSSVDLYTSIQGNLTDAFVGRKRYDDRGGVQNRGHVRSQSSF